MIGLNLYFFELDFDLVYLYMLVAVAELLNDLRGEIELGDGK